MSVENTSKQAYDELITSLNVPPAETSQDLSIKHFNQYIRTKKVIDEVNKHFCPGQGTCTRGAVSWTLDFASQYTSIDDEIPIGIASSQCIFAKVKGKGIDQNDIRSFVKLVKKSSVDSIEVDNLLFDSINGRILNFLTSIRPDFSKNVMKYTHSFVTEVFGSGAKWPLDEIIKVTKPVCPINPKWKDKPNQLYYASAFTCMAPPPLTTTCSHNQPSTMC